MAFVNQVVISNMIHDNDRRNRLQAMGASLAVHAALFAALFHAVATTPPVFAHKRETVTISLAGYGGAHAAQTADRKQAVAKITPAPMVKQAPKQIHTLPPKKTPHPIPAETIVEKHPDPAPIPQPLPEMTSEIKTPQPDTTPLSEALASNPSRTVTSAASPDSPPTPSLTQRDSSPSAISKANPTGPDATVLGQIRAMIENAITYPSVARRLRIEGVVILSFILAPNGAVAEAEVLHSSGSTILDHKALDTLWELSGDFPSLESTTPLTIPITFSLTTS